MTNCENTQQEEKYLDIVKAVSSKNRLLVSPRLRGKFLRKKLILKSLLQQKTRFSEVIGNLLESLYILTSPFLKLLPSIRRPESELIGNLIFDYFFGNLPRNPVSFFHYKLHYLPENENEISIRNQYLHFCILVELVEEIVILNHYGARNFLEKDSIIIDAGANIGVFSLFANFLSPRGQIYSFEPAPKPFKILCKNILNNNLLNNILAFQQALGERRKEMKLLISSDALQASTTIEDSGFFKAKKEHFLNPKTVSITTIDEFVFTNKIKQVDFLKIDVEGYEKQVIMGAKETIKKFSPTIACAAYHLKNDRVEIPKLVKFISPEYEFKFSDETKEILLFVHRKNNNIKIFRHE